MPIIKNEQDGYDNEVGGKEEKITAPAILPKSILRGKDVAVGDQIVLTIDRIAEDQISVSYQSDSSSKESEPPAEQAEESDMDEEPVSEGLSGYE